MVVELKWGALKAHASNVPTKKDITTSTLIDPTKSSSMNNGSP